MPSATHRRQNGFTLIEVMIVVAIIGILASVAIPLYQSHVARSQVARVMAESSGLRALIETCLSRGLQTIGSGADQCDPEAVSSNLITGASQTGATLLPGQGVPQVAIAAGGAVTIIATFSPSAVPMIKGETLAWSRTTTGTWNCTTSVDSVYRVKGCE